MIYCLLLLIIFFIIVVVKNNRQYKYNIAASNLYSIYDMEKNKISTIDILSNTLDLSDIDSSYDTIFLKISLKSSILSYIFEPNISLNKQKQYFEYGSKGTRYINLSSMAGKIITLKMNFMRFSKKNLSLYGYNNNVNINDKILILAPHADDAEIASFGLYKSAKNVTIVTLTTGENGVCKYCDLYSTSLEASIKKAELRSFNALTTGMLGNVNISNSIMLGYYGGSLTKMAKDKQKIISSDITNFPDMNQFRKVNHSNFNLITKSKSQYSYFYNDIRTIVDELKPSIIISPHPQIDSNPDHQQTTKTLLDILDELQLTPKLLLYTNHLPISELYPYGKIFSNISLPPINKHFHFDSVLSYPLTENLQKDKFFALENMYDLRDSILPLSLKRSYKHFIRMLIKKIYVKDKSYFRRSLRSNELFFVVEHNLTKNEIIVK